MSIESVFPDRAAMEQLLAMGMEEGLTEAVGQIDAILAERSVASTLAEPLERSERASKETTMTTTTTAAEPIDPDPRGAGRDADLRRPAERRDHRAATRPDRLADGRRRASRSLAAHFPDRTLVTYDPRNNGERSPADDPSQPITPEVQADDVHAVIEAVGGGPVDLFASSGGAIVALALVAKYPNDVRTARRARAAARVARAGSRARPRGDRRHQRRLPGAAAPEPGWRTSCRSSCTAARSRRRSSPRHRPDPAMFGMPAEDDGIRTDLMLAHNMLLT